MLRRMKDEILTGLPEKKARKYPVEMPAARPITGGRGSSVFGVKNAHGEQ